MSPEFVEMTAMAVANQNALVRGDAATPAEVRDLMSYADLSPEAGASQDAPAFSERRLPAGRSAGIPAGRLEGGGPAGWKPALHCFPPFWRG